MHSLLRIANILNAKYKKIKESICNNMTLRDCNDEEINKNKNKILSKSMASKI